MTALTLDQVLAASRVDDLQQAIVATLQARLPWCDVTAHPGKLDIADVAAADSFKAPALAVAVVGQKKPVRLPAGTHHRPVDLAVYVVTEDRAHAGRRIARDTLGRALCDALLDLLADDAAARWALDDIGFPEDAQARPLFTAKSFKQGATYFAVTWTQELHVGAPLFDTETPVPPDIVPHVYFPEDPPPPPPEPAP